MSHASSEPSHGDEPIGMAQLLEGGDSSERLALRFNLVLVSAGVAAAAGVGYTLLTGAQVPTVRSCVAPIPFAAIR